MNMYSDFYKDADGMMYQVITIAVSAEDNNKYVVYQEMNPKFQCYIMSEEKFNNCFKKYIFETKSTTNHQAMPKDVVEDKEYLDSPIKNLMEFLDAKSINEKLNILDLIKDSIDENTITSIELSLEMPSCFGDIDSRIEAVRRTLRAHEKYEGRRLR